MPSALCPIQKEKLVDKMGVSLGLDFYTSPTTNTKALLNIYIIKYENYSKFKRSY